MGKSLESNMITGALTVNWVWATQKHRKRRDANVWSGSKAISETGRGNTGTRESLPTPHELAGMGCPRDKTTGINKAPAALLIRKEKLQAEVVFVPRETEGKEKVGGSLSIPIVPIESREIKPDESRLLGKGKFCNQKGCGRMPIQRTVIWTH